MKIKYFAFILMFACALGVGCDPVYHNLTIVNKTDRTITIYKSKEMPLNHSDILNTFKPKDSQSSIQFNFIVNAFTKRTDNRMATFESQFKTSDGKLHLLILDVDSLKSMVKNHLLDSISIKNAILKQLIYTKEEMEANGRVIVYDN